MPAQPSDRNEDGWVVFLQRALFSHYHTSAYALIIGTYFIAFATYLYLRLVSLVFPEKIVYYSTCEKHANQTIMRNELHYASTTFVFLVMGCFQVVCFFLLTISPRWLTVKRTMRSFESLEQKLRNELVFSIKRVMYTTILPTFIVYSLCSTVVICAIFYMVGMRDPVQSKWAQAIIYLFDAFILVYFLSFPLVSVVYHPRIRCRLKMWSSVGDRNASEEPVVATTNSAHLIAFRRSNGTISEPQNLQVSIESTRTTV
ncbi:hypothetical protein M3Y99_00728700 [Aphelenchoides fujianensis]|nr:hypothetical protein M3Y99_00728700 [Aphelenchoides fujianensis]